MEKKEFVRLMKGVIQLDKDQESINKAFQKLDSDFNYFSLGKCTTLILDAIKIAMNDEYDFINYWVYEKNFGKDKELKVFDKDNKVIPSDTLEQLYDLIKKYE
jgi:hypothetical protein